MLGAARLFSVYREVVHWRLLLAFSNLFNYISLRLIIPQQPLPALKKKMTEFSIKLKMDSI